MTEREGYAERLFDTRVGLEIRAALLLVRIGLELQGLARSGVAGDRVYAPAA